MNNPKDNLVEDNNDFSSDHKRYLVKFFDNSFIVLRAENMRDAMKIAAESVGNNIMSISRIGEE